MSLLRVPHLLVLAVACLLAAGCGPSQNPNTCVPKTETCNGVDDDCDGVVDNGYVADTSCFKKGVCASGNVASSCFQGEEIACRTGTPTASTDATCNGVDEDCDGTADEDYAPITSCFSQGACAGGNVASSCSNGVETACATGTPGASDATCNGVDEDCDGTADEDYAPITSCFKPGVCAAGNAASSCTAGVETACKTGAPTAADDATCNGVDEDCSGAADEDYVVVTSCFKPGTCAAGNVASSCTAGVETACATGTAAANDANCNGVDEDCSGQADEDYVAINSCFKPGVCAAGNAASTCVNGTETACKAGAPTSANDANCNGVDEDCSGQADEDYVAINSCFKPGVCSAGNAASTCINGTETACKTGNPTAASDTTCNGVDEDCSGAADEDYVAITSCYKPGVCAAGNAASTCVNGTETACKTGNPTLASDTTCNGVDEDCSGQADEDYQAINSCFKPGVCAAGNAASTCVNAVETACKTGVPTMASDTTCNNVDEDCSGQADEDYVAITSCFKPGVCAAGNSASRCTGGVETACSTGSPDSPTDLCYGKDNNCDGVTQMGCAALTKSTVSGAGVVDGDVGGAKAITIQSRDMSGAAITVGGANFTATAQPPGGGPAVSIPVLDNNNGTYSTQHTPATNGIVVVQVNSNAVGIDNTPSLPLYWTQLTSNSTQTCQGCYKDLFAGRYIYCNGFYAGATKSGCNWDGSNCTFAPQQNVNLATCKALCKAEVGCHYVTHYFGTICNLHMMTSCTMTSTSSAGSIFAGP